MKQTKKNNKKENKEAPNHLTPGKVYYIALWMYDLQF